MARTAFQQVIETTRRRPGRIRPSSRLAELYATLLQVNKAILRSPGAEELLQETCRICTQFGGFDLAWIGRPSAAGDGIAVVAAAGPKLDYLEGLQVSVDPDSPFSQGITGTCFREGRTAVCNDWDAALQTLPWRESARRHGIRASAAVPVFQRGRVAAVLTLYSGQVGFFLPDRLELLESLGWDLAIGLEHFARETERRAAEVSLWESELRFRTLFQATTIPMVISRHTTILEGNRSFQDQFDLDPETPLKGLSILDFLVPEQRPALRERNRLREAGAPVPDSFEVMGQSRRRPPFPLAVEATLLALPDGPVTLLCLKDLSEAKRHAEAIGLLNGRLERRVVERTHQLEETNRELTSFAHSISHDLRAPLRQISGFSDLLAERLGEGLDPKAAHFLEVIQGATRRMDQHIKDLLAFASLGLQPMHKTRLDLNRIVQSVQEQLLLEVGDRQVRWRVDPLPELEGDAGLLFFLFQNLLGNAVKFTRGRAEAIIEVLPMEGLEDRVGFLVRDNGAGFDPNQGHRLFGLFQRLHRTEDFEGTGIGLANAQRIVARHSGQIRAEGEVGRGATFYVTFPKPPRPQQGP